VKRTVLDASALISFFEGASGSVIIEELVVESFAANTELLMSVVNWGEVYYSAWRLRGQDAARQTAAEISQLPIQVVDADFEMTRSAAELRAKYKLPYADCFAAALCKIRRAKLATSDRDFALVRSEIEIQFL
jgi:predicted nucleic acid-binding protein